MTNVGCCRTTVRQSRSFETKKIVPIHYIANVINRGRLERAEKNTIPRRNRSNLYNTGRRAWIIPCSSNRHRRNVTSGQLGLSVCLLTHGGRDTRLVFVYYNSIYISMTMFTRETRYRCPYIPSRKIKPRWKSYAFRATSPLGRDKMARESVLQFISISVRQSNRVRTYYRWRVTRNARKFTKTSVKRQKPRFCKNIHYREGKKKIYN